MRHGTTVLIVEDNDILREALRDLVEALRPSWIVVEAANGLQGIEMVQENHPDVIVLDFNMPVMNGYEMALHLQQRPETRQIPLILNSSEDVDNPFIVRLRAMSHAVLHKPFSCHDLEAVLTNVFAKSTGTYPERRAAMQAIPA
ncbi:MAG: response regulator [Caldilineaceae bacterium]